MTAGPVLGGDSLDAAFNLGTLLARQGRLDEAVDAFRRADELGDAAGASNLGVLLEQRGDLTGAEAAYRRADERGDPSGAFNLGTLLAREGKLVQAIDAFRRADDLGDAAGASNLGVLLEQRGDLVGAEAAYRRADERGDASGAFLLGALLEQRGDLTEAKGAYQRADQRGTDVAAADVPNGARSDHRRKRARRAYLLCVGLLAVAGVIALTVGGMPGIRQAEPRHSPPAGLTTAVSAPIASAASASAKPGPPVDRHPVVGHRPTQTTRPRRPSAARIATRRQSSAGSRSGGDVRGGVDEGSRRATTSASAGSHRGGPSVGGETVGISPSPRGSNPTTPATPTAGSTGTQPGGRSGGVGIGAGTGTTSGGG